MKKHHHHEKHKHRAALFILLISAIIITAYELTGVLRHDHIDSNDLNYWNYTDQGTIQGSEAFHLDGNKDVCWLMIHGYTSAPNELKELATTINNEFNDYVYVPILKGHGRVPSKILNLSLDDWYIQVEEHYQKLERECNQINLVGSSFGGALSLRLSQEKAPSRVYLLAPYLIATYNKIFIFKIETYIDLFEDSLTYIKKPNLAQIDNPEGIKDHIAYWNMPLAPVKNSKAFIEKVKNNLNKIHAPLLTQHSKRDDVADIKSSELIYQEISSKIKDFIIYEKSNHVLTKDYDKEEVMINIINFEKKFR